MLVSIVGTLPRHVRSSGISGLEADIIKTALAHLVTSTPSIDALRKLTLPQTWHVLGFGAPGQLRSLALQEHGRTIPLEADIDERSMTFA